MSTTELLLLRPLEGLGHEGETVKVRAGYARNFLLPRKMAIPKTHSNRRQIDALVRDRETRIARELANAEEIAAKVRKAHIALAVKTGPGGRVFGAITAANLIDRLADEGINVDRKQLSLEGPVKSLGKHTTQIRLHAEVTVDLDFEVVSENPIDEE
jgi:large subunit ribosomal protein L9